MYRKFAIRMFVSVLAMVSLPVQAETQGTRVLLIVLDGLRPDYVEPNLMPNLYAWARQGVVFDNHHATFPTVTRVNASSISTGAYPESHGIADNSVYFPEVEPKESLSTGDRGNLERINEHTGGNLLTAKSLGELLAEQGMKTAVFSSGSSGSAFLLNHKVPNGAIVHNGYILPAELADTLAPRMGPEPPDASPNRERNARIVDAYLDFSLNDMDAELTIMWLSDPDHTAHEYGMATSETTRALRLVDGLLGRIEDQLAASGRLATTNILVTSDHGFSTHIPPDDQGKALADFVAAHKLPPDAIITTGSCAYVNEPYKELVPALVKALQAADWMGPLFTRAKAPGSTEGWVEGTLAMDVVRGGHPERAPDILFSCAWTDEEAVRGYRGTAAKGGVAGHGTSSPWDVHNTLIVRGPDFLSRWRIGLPSHNTDLAPTVCHLLGITPAHTMKGRVLHEAMVSEDPEAPAAVATETIEAGTALPDGQRYRMTATRSFYRDVVYFDQAWGGRD